MKTGAKIAVGILVILLMLCVIGGILLYSSGYLQKFTHFAGGISKIAKTAKSAEALDKAFPFTPPESGAVPEDRLKAYMAVCNKVKPVSEPYEEWFREHQGQSGDFKDAQDGLRMTSSIMSTFVDALTAEKMSPVEFRWIDKAMRQASRDASRAGNTVLERQMLATLEAQAERPGLSGPDRRALRDQIEKYKARLGTGEKTKGAVLANMELYQKYTDDLRACELGDFARSMVLGLGGGHGGRNHGRVVIHTD
jgi:hypothetical protein